ncbi:MAG: hypothetical protein VKL42_23665 [Snowella sp.]|nr:hypothetical protein [Snowella sp.]
MSDDQSNIVEIKKIHFAMNAQWSDNGSHIHEINDQETLFNWILGLLKNIKFQLEYAS